MRLYRPVTRTVMAVQWNGSNETEVRELLGDWPFPPIGHWVVVDGSRSAVLDPGEFASTYEPLGAF